MPTHDEARLEDLVCRRRTVGFPWADLRACGRSGARWWISAAVLTGWVLCAVFLCAVVSTPGWAQDGAQDDVELESEEVPTVEFVLLRPTRDLLADFQDRWIDWTTSVRSGDRMGAEQAADLIMAGAGELGLKGLPDLALGAAALARSLAAEGASERAAIALESAERFDPGRPETRFAAAAVADAGGQRIAAHRARLAALSISLTTPEYRQLLLANFAIWFATVVQIGGGLFVCLVMATHGRSMVQQVTQALEANLPTWAAVALVVVLLIWPVALPGGLAWLLVYWSVLLWGYAGRVERAVLAAFWLLLALSPILVELQSDRVGVGLSSSVRALERLQGERFGGSVFTDIATMREALPESVALLQVTADVHRRLGQWGPAQTVYLRVLDAEPDNTEALTGLGVSYLQRGDVVQAADAFRRATTDGPPQAAAFFHLSTLLSAQYDFTESRAALESARDLDRGAVDDWLESGNEVVAPDGGIARAEEVETALVRRWRGEMDTWADRLGQLALSVPVALVFLALAVVLQLVLRRTKRRPPEKVGWLTGVPEKIRRCLVPGLAEAEGGQWLRAFAWVLVFVGFTAIPLAARVGFPMPWADSAASTSLFIVVVIGLLLYWSVRAVIWWRHD